MADGDGRAFRRRVAGRKIELTKNGFACFDVVEKNLAGCGGDASLLGGSVSDGGRSGAAVDKEEIATAQVLHEFGHEPRLGGSERAFVIVDPDDVRDLGEHLAEQTVDFVSRHSYTQFYGLSLGGIALKFHRQVKHDLVTAAVSFVGDLGGMRLTWEHG